MTVYSSGAYNWIACTLGMYSVLCNTGCGLCVSWHETQGLHLASGLLHVFYSEGLFFLVLSYQDQGMVAENKSWRLFQLLISVEIASMHCLSL